MKHSTIIVAIGLALAGLLSAAPAQALNARSFVSGQGVDSNACTLAAPCRTFAAAILQTNAGGEILTLNPAGYGGLTINKSISIVSSLGVGGVNMLTAGNAITISAGPNDIVSLRGLNIDGLGLGTNGIVFNTGGSLTIENCVIRHLTSSGINFVSTTATSALTVSNSLVADNGINGILLGPTGSATAVFNRVEANNNGEHGILVDGEFSAGTNTINATVSDSVAAGNNVGFEARSPTSAAPTSVMVFHSVAANNTSGGVSPNGTAATLRLANSTVTGNANGWLVQSGGVVASYGDNYIDGNGSNTGILTSISKQ